MNLEVGNIVGISDNIRVSNLGKLVFQADLDQEDFKEIKENQNVEIELDSYPNERFKGVVLNKPMFVDEESITKTFKVKIGINQELIDTGNKQCDEKGNCLNETQNNVQGKIVKGMTGDANIITAVSANTAYLPFDAINFGESGKSYVWTIDSSNKLIKTFVEIGLEGDTLTEIKNKDIKEVVVPISGSKELKEGTVATFN